jgi:hypothetical protein
MNCFLFFWVIFSLLDPDRGTPLNPDPIRFRSTTLVGLGDPDAILRFGSKKAKIAYYDKKI